jgi:hypothetical protein
VTRRGARTALVSVLALAASAGLAACGSDSSPTTTTTVGVRPKTTAQIQIVEPAPGAVIHGTSMTIRVQVTGGKVVSRVDGAMSSTEGHAHMMIDGEMVAMAYKDTQRVDGLKPGPHTLTVEFVAIDHKPFANPQIATSTFEVVAS